MWFCFVGRDDRRAFVIDAPQQEPVFYMGELTQELRDHRHETSVQEDGPVGGVANNVD